MKPLTLLLAGSLLVNAALAVAIVRRDRSPTPPRISPADGVFENPAHLKPLSQGWKDLALDAVPEGEDSAFVEALRAQGFPPTVIRAWVTERVQERFAARRKAIEDENPITYWRADSGYSSESLKRRTALRDLQREQSDALRALLGPDAEPAYVRSMYQRRYGGLSPEKVRLLNILESDYSDLTSQIRNEAMGITLPGDRERLAYLEQEKQADLAKLLTPEEFAAYELRSSPTANQIKSRIAFFDATEPEYLALFRLQKNFDTAFPSTLKPDAQQLEQRTQAQKKLNADIEAAFGPERYAAYKIATDPSYRSVNQIVARLELPETTTRQVIAFQQDGQQRTAAIRADRALTADQRNAQLAALAQDASLKLTTLLGAEGFTAYKQGVGGSWLNSLQPRPQPTPPPKS